nr:DUF4239 domain-containing protein [Paludisphaera mucosa]
MRLLRPAPGPDRSRGPSELLGLRPGRDRGGRGHERPHRDVSNYSEPDRTELQGVLREYARFVIEEAWPLQRESLTTEKGGERPAAVLTRLAAHEPKTKRQERLHAESLRAFNELSKPRRMRVFRVSTGIPAIMWYVVMIGAFMNIMIVRLFDMKLIAHLFLGGLLSFCIMSFTARSC